MLASSRFIVAASALLLLVSARSASAQGRAPAAATSGVGEIRGRLVESGSGRAISGGSVAVARVGDSSVVGGALPQPDGSFRVDGLAAGRYTVRIRAIGFAPIVRSGVVISAEKRVADLGTLSLSVVAATLEGQTVTAERADVALAPDRNSYSAKNMITASGGTAVDVLRNVPSVEVDGSNKVTLRGSENVVVQINGRPSPLKGEQLGIFLAQLPASTVSRVEVATNPSAKNDPEGTAGIINIILNQETETGLSGGFSAGTSTTGLVNLSGNVGRQSGPLTLFASGSLYRATYDQAGTSSLTNIAVPVPAFVDSRSSGSTRPTSVGLTLRSEYRFTPHDALSFDAFADGGRYNSDNAAYYTDLNDSRAVIGLFDQFSNRLSRNTSQDYTVAFRRTGGAKATTFSSELRYSNNYGTGNTDLSGALHQADISTGLTSTRREHDYTTDAFPSWTLQTDYTHPFGTASKLESGFKGTVRSLTNDFTAAYYDSASALYVPAPARTTSFDYREQIAAAYAVLSQQVSKVQAQAGLRLEHAATRLNLPNASTSTQQYDSRYDNNYASAFPSGILSYNFTPLRQAKLSYSRRISRPNPYQLTPIEYRADARTVFRGNPALRPEYTNAFELGLQEGRTWGSIQLNPYLRNTAHAVRFIQTVDASGVTLSTYDNVASTMTAGADLNLTYHRGPVSLFSGGSVYRYTSDASNLAGNLSARAVVWSVRTNATWKFSAVTDVQLFANYRAPSATEGGTQLAFVSTNLAVRRKLWGDHGNISLRVADPFNLMKFGYRTANGRVIQLTERHFGQRGLYLTLSRNFGQQLKLRPKSQDTDTQSAPVPGVP
ncbi:MAG: TonB-dependent receptor domain-containing protein [Gemmatimonadaceae bacterium]